MINAKTIKTEHPGVFIKEELEARGWSQVDLAYILGMSVAQLNPILNGKNGVSPDMAVMLGDAFDVSPEFFANLQKLYELGQAKVPDAGVKKRASWVSKFPVREMIKRGWIDDTEADLLDLQMMRFFNANRIEDVPLAGDAEIVAHAAKKTGYDEVSPTQLVWLWRVRGVAQTIECPDYSEDALKAALPDIRAHMNAKDDLSRIPHILTRCGVRFVVVEALPGSKIDGVCTWIDGQPVIGISTRLDRIDNLCFVIRHEIEHVLQGDGRDGAYSHVDVFDEDRDPTLLPDEEKRADAAAAEFLLPQAKLASFMKRKGRFISERDVIGFAARHHIHPGVVIGQIQRERHKQGDDRAYSWLRKYLTNVRNYMIAWEYVDGWGKVAPVRL